MSQILILLNSSSDNHPSLTGISPFTFIKKDAVRDVLTQTSLAYNATEFIVLEDNPENPQLDLDIIKLLKTNPAFAATPLLVLTSKHNLEGTLIYFEYGATTCLLQPNAADEWLNIIKNIPAYWNDAA